MRIGAVVMFFAVASFVAHSQESGPEGPSFGLKGLERLKPREFSPFPLSRMYRHGPERDCPSVLNKAISEECEERSRQKGGALNPSGGHPSADCTWPPKNECGNLRFYNCDLERGSCLADQTHCIEYNKLEVECLQEERDRAIPRFNDYLDSIPKVVEEIAAGATAASPLADAFRTSGGCSSDYKAARAALQPMEEAISQLSRLERQMSRDLRTTIGAARTNELRSSAISGPISVQFDVDASGGGRISFVRPPADTREAKWEIRAIDESFTAPFFDWDVSYVKLGAVDIRTKESSPSWRVPHAGGDFTADKRKWDLLVDEGYRFCSATFEARKMSYVCAGTAYSDPRGFHVEAFVRSSASFDNDWQGELDVNMTIREISGDATACQGRELGCAAFPQTRFDTHDRCDNHSLNPDVSEPSCQKTQCVRGTVLCSSGVISQTSGQCEMRGMPYPCGACSDW